MSEYIVETFGIVQDFADLHGDMNTPLYQAIMDVMVSRQHEEIVRCRDCRYLDDREAERWDSTLAEIYGEPPMYCESPQWDGPYLHRPVKPNGFCAWGERRDDGIN